MCDTIPLEEAETKLERVMSQLPQGASNESTRKNYLAGVIDTWADLQHISHENRDILYLKYVDS